MGDECDGVSALEVSEQSVQCIPIRMQVGHVGIPNCKSGIVQLQAKHQASRPQGGCHDLRVVCSSSYGISHYAG